MSDIKKYPSAYKVDDCEWRSVNLTNDELENLKKRVDEIERKLNVLDNTFRITSIRSTNEQ